MTHKEKHSVTLLLPKDLIMTVDDYGESEVRSRSSTIIYFLRKGLASENVPIIEVVDADITV